MISTEPHFNHMIFPFKKPMIFGQIPILMTKPPFVIIKSPFLTDKLPFVVVKSQFFMVKSPCLIVQKHNFQWLQLVSSTTKMPSYWYRAPRHCQLADHWEEQGASASSSRAIQRGCCWGRCHSPPAKTWRYWPP